MSTGAETHENHGSHETTGASNGWLETTGRSIYKLAWGALKTFGSELFLDAGTAAAKLGIAVTTATGSLAAPLVLGAVLLGSGFLLGYPRKTSEDEKFTYGVIKAARGLAGLCIPFISPALAPFRGILKIASAASTFWGSRKD